MELIVDYREHYPSTPLGVYVHRMASAFFPQPIPPERLAPDGYLKLAMILEGDPIYYESGGATLDWKEGFSGHVSPQRAIMCRNEAPIRCVMANFYPSAFYMLFGRPLHTFNDRMLPMSQLLGDRADALYRELRTTRDPAVMFAAVEAMIMERVDALPDSTPTVMMAVEQRIRASKGTVVMKEIAEEMGLPMRQLQRKCIDEIGLAPKAFASVVRFNNAYAMMQRDRKLDIDTALACGYYDVSHMLKDLSYYLGDAAKHFINMVRPNVDASLGH